MVDQKFTRIRKSHIIIVIITIWIIIISSGYFYYRNENDQITSEKENVLHAVADLKIKQIIQWCNGRAGDAALIESSPFFGRGIEEWLAGIKGAEEAVTRRLLITQKQYGYHSILISSPRAKLLLSVGAKFPGFDQETSSKIFEAIKSHSITYTDFYKSKIGKMIFYDIIIPLYNIKKEPVCSVILRINPDDNIYPLINAWPTPEHSAETYIFRKEGNSVLFLNELRNRKNSALNFRLSLERKDIPCAKLVSGYTGIYNGKDYRGVNVLAYVSPVFGTPWYMVTKVDKSELFRELYSHIWLIVFLMILAIIAVSAGVASFYSRKQKNFYKMLLDKEKDLYQTQERFKKTIDSIGEGVITTDVFGKIEYMNNLAEKLTGWNLDEAKGEVLEKIYDITNELTGEKEEHAVQKVLKSGFVKGLANHTLLKAKNGHILPVMDTGAPIFDTDGTITGVVLVFQDETEKRKQQAALQESEARFRFALDGMLEAAQIIDFNWHYIYLNDMAVKHANQSRENLINFTIMEKYPGIESTNIFKLMNECMIERKTGHDEFEFVFPDGSARWYDFKVQPVPEGIFILTLDITERKHSEEEYKKLSRAVIQSPITVVITNTQGDIEYINPKFTEVTGYTLEEVAGKNPRLLKSGYHDKQFYEDLWKTILSGQDWKGEIQNKKKSGELFWDSSIISPVVNENNVITHFVAVKEDITEKKNMLHELITAKEKAEEMNRIKTHFFANMSHELRTPFVGIMGYAELLLDSAENEEMREIAEGILSTSTRMKETLTKILELTKVEFEKHEITLSEVDVVDLIDKVYKQFVIRAEQKKISLNRKVCFDSLVITTDEYILNSILDNLVSNAIIYTSRGWIDISAEVIFENNRETLILKVTDTGIGIPKEKQEIIWDEFRQVSEGTSRNFQGTGLGLAIVKHYVASLSGKAYVESEVGKGSTFTVELPVFKSHAGEIIKETFSDERSIIPEKNISLKISKKNILYVEDDKTSRYVIKKALSNFYDVDTAKNAEEAISKLNVNGFDAILMDINLGQKPDGLELTKIIRDMNGCDTIPIIAVTAYASSEDKKEFLQKGLNYYIAKPFSMKELFNLLGKVFAASNTV